MMERINIMAWISRDELDRMRKEIELLRIEYSRLQRENRLLTTEHKLMKYRIAFLESTNEFHEQYENEVSNVMKSLENLRLENRSK